jgi:hypothetical protein
MISSGSYSLMEISWSTVGIPSCSANTSTWEMVASEIGMMVQKRRWIRCPVSKDMKKWSPLEFPVGLVAIAPRVRDLVSLLVPSYTWTYVPNLRGMVLKSGLGSPVTMLAGDSVLLIPSGCGKLL